MGSMTGTVCRALLLLLLTSCASVGGNTVVAPGAERVGVQETAAKGTRLALAYSEAGRKVYLGRSSVSEKDALDVAVASCPYSDCRSRYSTVSNGCVAFAVSPALGWGRASGVNQEEAAKKAVKLCNAHTDNDSCTLRVVLCPEF